MKGIVFREFVNMVEARFGEDMMDELFENTALPSRGVYTSVGTYDPAELVALAEALAKRTGDSVPSLIHNLGRHLASVFALKFPAFFAECSDTISFLKTIDNHIHVEVMKLYPDAELPKFSYVQNDDNSFTLKYESTRSFAHLAHGLIEGTMAHYGERFDVDREDVSTSHLTAVAFTLRRL